MQPFQVPRATIPGQQKRPGPGVPGQRPPGPVPGMRPGGPGFPGPGGAKPPGPIGGPVQQQIPPTNPVEEQPHPKEIVQKEPEKVQPPEPKPEPKIEQPPTQPEKRPGPPQFQPKPQPGPGGPKGMPGPQGQFQPKPQTQQQLQPKPVVAQPESRVEAPQPKQITKPEPQHEEPKPQPVMKQSPEFQQKTQYRSVGREGEDQSSDQLVRLSESLQAMKSLRNNFQGFNVPAGGNEEEEQEEEEEEEGEGEEGEEEEEEQEEYEGEEDDDYVRVEGNEEEEEKEEEGEEGEEEEESEEGEEEEEQQYEQEAEVPKQQTQEPPAIFRQEKPAPVKEQPRPQIQAQINQQPRPQIPGQISQQPRPQIPGQQPRPQVAHNEPHGRIPHHGGPPGGIPQRNPIPVQTKEIPQEKRPSFRAVEEQQQPPHKPQTVQQHHPPSGGLHQEAKSPFIPQQEKSLVPEPQHAPVRDEPHQHQHHAPVSAAKVKQSQERKRSSIVEKESVEERIVKEPEVRNDPNLVLKLEQLERELEKERVKVAHLESEQQNLITENATLKHKNSELAAKVNLFSRKGESDRPHSRPDLEALRAELTNGLEECRQLSESTNRVIYEASQYREESESIVRGLEEDKNRLYEQVMELRRQIDEEYNNELESFRQRTELLENRILDYEGNFKLAQTQLQEKNETLQRVTSLNNEIQSVLSSIPQVSYQPTETYVPSIPVQRAPVTVPATTTTQPAKVSQVEKPEIKQAAPAVAKRTNENPFSKDEHKPEVHEQKPAVTAAPQVRKESFPTQAAQPKVQPKEDNSRKGSIVEEKKHVEAEERPPAFKPPQQTHPAVNTTTVSSEGLTAPPNYRMPNRPKKDEPPKRQPLPVKSFQDDVLASFEISNDNEPQTQIEAPPQKHEPKVESHPPVHNVTQSRSKIQKMDKSLFNDDAGDNFFGSTQAQPEPTYQYEEQQEQEHQQYEQTPPEQYYQQEQTATGYGEDYYTQNAYQESYGAVQENPVSNVSSTKQSKSNLRYSQGQETTQKEQQSGAISAEAAENFFDQLGQSQPEPIPQFQPPVQQQRPPFQAQQPQPQAHTAHTQNLTASTQLRNKAHIHSPPKRGKNPFADEEETAQSTDFLSSFQNESFVDRSEAQRPMQPKLAANPIQTAGPGPKKVDEPKSGLAKSSVLKKAKGNIPAAMFD